MKRLSYYDNKNLKSSTDIFNYFEETLINTNQTWDYFNDWNKVYSNLKKYNIELNILNSLCNTHNFNEELTNLLLKYPEIIQVFPILIGVRNKKNKISVLDDEKLPEFNYHDFDFQKKKLSDKDIQNFIIFFQKSGLKDFILNKGVTNLKDYVHGIEIGLDTNARKNRSGSFMQNFINKLLVNVYNLKEGDTFIEEGSAANILDLWNIDLPMDKSSRKPDFVVNKNKRLFWIETNFYSGGGSKLKSTCGEYKSLSDFCKSKNIVFIWITDGKGWKTTLKPLQETFENNDYIFNLNMVKNGILEYVWEKN